MDLLVLTPGGVDVIRLTAAGSAPRYQAAVPADAWFGAELAEPTGYALLGCVMAPGFDFADFELGRRAALLAEYPAARDVIERLTTEEDPG